MSSANTNGLIVATYYKNINYRSATVFDTQIITYRLRVATTEDQRDINQHFGNQFVITKQVSTYTAVGSDHRDPIILTSGDNPYDALLHVAFWDTYGGDIAQFHALALLAKEHSRVLGGYNYRLWELTREYKNTKKSLARKIENNRKKGKPVDALRVQLTDVERAYTAQSETITTERDLKAYQYNCDFAAESKKYDLTEVFDV